MFKHVIISLIVFGSFDVLTPFSSLAGGDEVAQWRKEACESLHLPSTTKFLFVDSFGPCSSQPQAQVVSVTNTPGLDPSFGRQRFGFKTPKQVGTMHNAQAQNARRAEEIRRAEQARRAEAERQAKIQKENQARSNLALAAAFEAESDIRLSRAQAEAQAQWEPIRQRAQDNIDATIEGMKEDSRRQAETNAKAAERYADMNDRIARLGRNRPAPTELDLPGIGKIPLHYSSEPAAAPSTSGGRKLMIAGIGEITIGGENSSESAPKALRDIFCFPGETLINVLDVASTRVHQQRIDSIRIGDTVVSCDVSVSGGQCEFGIVKAVGQRTAEALVSLSFSSGGERLRTTLEHPIYSVDKEIYQNANDFNIGDQVFGLTDGLTNEILTITGKEFDTQDTLVYNLEVEGNNNYYACSVLVHNCHLPPVVAAVGNVAAEVAGAGLGEAAIIGGAAALAGPVAFVGTAALGGYALHKMTQSSDEAGPSTGATDSVGETPVVQDTSRAPKEGGIPNSIHEKINPKTGDVDSRTFFDKNGRPFSRQDFDHDHGGMKPHEHKMGFDAQGRPIVRKTRPKVPSGYDSTPTSK